jgi:selenocysteine-specific elongation factor
MFNVNIGILGHVDSGKTSLAKALSTVSSTAAFDKSPQSHERGITLDLGFSAFVVDVSDQKEWFGSYDTMQVTLVDCPGHGSLIRTVIGGAHIIDAVLLVIDVTKGIQTQTAECLVVGEMIGKPLLVALNKVDAVQGATAQDKEAAIKKMKKRLEATFAQTRWPDVSFVEVAAAPTAADNSPLAPIGIAELVKGMVSLVRPQSPASDRNHNPPAPRGGVPFLMYIDHCFAVKGHGTVLTGTVVQGTVKVGEEVCLPDFLEQRRVKGIQMFRKPMQSASRGDRIGLCVGQFDAKEMERGIVCGSKSDVGTGVQTAIAIVKKVRFHKLPVEGGMTMHLSLGHTTVMGSMRFFSCPGDVDTFDAAREYQHLDQLPEDSVQRYAKPETAAGGSGMRGAPLPTAPSERTVFAVVTFDRPITVMMNSLLIASHLDTDIHANVCRLAVEGRLVQLHADDWRSAVKAVRWKSKRIQIDRILDQRTCIAKGLARPREDLAHDKKAMGAQLGADVMKFVGASVHYVVVNRPGEAPVDMASAPPADAVVGKVEAPFGKTGKVRIVFPVQVFSDESVAAAQNKKRKGPPPKQTAAAAAEDDDEEEDGAPQPQQQSAQQRGGIYLFTKRFPFAS